MAEDATCLELKPAQLPCAHWLPLTKPANAMQIYVLGASGAPLRLEN